MRLKHKEQDRKEKTEAGVTMNGLKESQMPLKCDLHDGRRLHPFCLLW